MVHPGLSRENQEEALDVKGKDHYDLRKQEGRHVLGPERAPELEKGTGRVEAGGREQKGLPLLPRCLICQSLNCGSEADIEQGHYLRTKLWPSDFPASITLSIFYMQPSHQSPLFWGQQGSHFICGPPSRMDA